MALKAEFDTLYLVPQNQQNMKIFFSLLCILGSFSLLAQNPIDGDWKGTRDTPNGPMEFTYTFKVQDSVLNGTLKSQFGEMPLENGKVNGKTFSYSISFNGNSFASTGELTGEDEITVKSDRGEIKLLRVKG